MREGTRRGGVREDGKVTSKLGRRSLPVMRAPRGPSNLRTRAQGKLTDGQDAEKGGARYEQSGSREQAAKNMSAAVHERTCVVARREAGRPKDQSRQRRLVRVTLTFACFGNFSQCGEEFLCRKKGNGKGQRKRQRKRQRKLSCTDNAHFAPLRFLLLEFDRHDRERIYDNSHMIMTL